MKNRLLMSVKLVTTALISLLWFILIQGEYEMITKPELQNDFPIMKGISAVYVLGFILLLLGSIVVYLLKNLKATFMKKIDNES